MNDSSRSVVKHSRVVSTLCGISVPKSCGTSGLNSKAVGFAEFGPCVFAHIVRKPAQMMDVATICVSILALAVSEAGRRKLQLADGVEKPASFIGESFGFIF